MLLASPVINMVAYGVLWWTSGWIAALTTFAIWVIVMYMQKYSSELKKKFKIKESGYNDERQKLINDVVNGARTIKSYGWENHYLKKIFSERMKQKSLLMY